MIRRSTDTVNQEHLSGPLIERSYRLRFVLELSLAAIVVFGAGTVALNFALDRPLDSGYGAAFLSLLSTRNLLLRYIILSAVFQALILSVLVSVIAIFTTHKIAGPVHRMKMFLRAYRERRWLPGGLRLRAGDQVRAVAMTMEEALRETGRRCNELADEAQCMAKEIEDGAEPDEKRIEAFRVRLRGLRVE